MTNIYFVEDVTHGLIKIGHAANPYARLSSGRAFNPGKLEMVGFYEATVEEEAELHRCFERSRVTHEWFRKTPELLALIADKCRDFKPPEHWRRRAFCPACGREGKASVDGYCRSHVHLRAA